MPRMNGAELATALASEQPGLKVLFMTGDTDDATLLGAVGEAGAESCEKPFTNEALLGHLRRVLGPARASA